MSRLCEAAGLVDTIIDLPPSGSSKDWAQRAALLKEFYKAGHKQALSKLYAMCNFENPHDEIFGCDELIEIDGEQGFLFVAKREGEKLSRDANYWITDWQLSSFDELYGSARGKALLTEAATDDSNIRCYLEKLLNLEKQEAPGKAVEPEATQSVENVLEVIRSATKRVGWLRGWGGNASSADRMKVVKLLKSETSSIVLTNALFCLSSHGIPVFDEALLTLVFHDDDDVRYFASIVFSRHDHPQVRDVGLAFLNKGELGVATQLLQLSARQEDSLAIVSALANYSGEVEHGIPSNLICLLEENDSVLEPLIPLYIYEFSTCGICRQRAVETLIKWKTCPQWLLVEAARDASDRIRLLADSQ